MLKSQCLWLLLLFAAAWMLRYASWCHDPLCTRDAVGYINMAGNNVYSVDLPFYNRDTMSKGLFLILLRAGEACGWNLEHFGVMLNITLSAATAVILFFTARSWGFLPTGAWCVAAIAALHPVLVRESHQVLREPLYCFFCCWWAFFFVGALRHECFIRMTTAGSMAALAFFTRYEAAELLIVSWIIILFFRCVCQRKIRRFFIDCACFSGGYVAVGLALFSMLPGNNIRSMLNRVFFLLAR